MKTSLTRDAGDDATRTPSRRALRGGARRAGRLKRWLHRARPADLVGARRRPGRRRLLRPAGPGRRAGRGCRGALRVQARQAHVYALAPSSSAGPGPASAARRHGLTAVLARRGDDGLYRRAAPDSGAALDGMGLLYDQAFVLLALAAAHAPTRRRRRWRRRRWRCWTGSPTSPTRSAATPRRPGLAAPLFANPNMHLFEAFQAWSATSDNPIWRERAAGQAELALERLIDPRDRRAGRAVRAGLVAAGRARPTGASGPATSTSGPGC